MTKGLLELYFQADGIQQIRIERLRKMLVQDLKSQLRNQGRVETQGLGHFRCETACDVVFEQLRLPDVRIAGSMLQSTGMTTVISSGEIRARATDADVVGKNPRSPFFELVGGITGKHRVPN